MTLATCMNTSFLDRLYKKQATMDTYNLSERAGTQTRTLTCSGLQSAKQLDSRGVIVRIIVTEVLDAVLLFLPSYISQETDGEQTNEFTDQLID